MVFKRSSLVKSSNLDIKYFNTNLKNSIKSKWFLALVLFPVVLYLIYLMVEPRLLSFVVSLFPEETDKSIGFYRDFLELIFTELLWISGFFLLTWIFVVYVPLTRVIHSLSTRLTSKSGIYAFIIIFLSFVGSLIVSNYTLDRFANSSDEYAYLYQAETLGQGRLWEYAHDHAEFFYFNHIAHKDGISVSRFPPGWPLILSASYFFGFPPFIVNPILGLLTLVVFYFFAKRVYGQQVALWSLIAVALSSFFVFNAASYFSHTSSE